MNKEIKNGFSETTKENEERWRVFREEMDREMRSLEAAKRKSLLAKSATAGCMIIGSAFLGAALWASGMLESFTGKTTEEKLTDQQKIYLKESKEKIDRMLSPLILGSIGIKTGEFDIQNRNEERHKEEKLEKENGEKTELYEKLKQIQDTREAKKKVEEEKDKQLQEERKKAEEYEKKMRGRR